MVTNAAAAVTISDNCVLAPARRFTAVWVVPPPPGIAPKNALPALANPVARSSRLALGGGSLLLAKARPAATVSVKLISAIPTAPGHNAAARERFGITGDGKPLGMWPTSATPWVCRLSKYAPAIPDITAMSGAGAFGANLSSSTSIAIIDTPTSNVAQDAWERPRKMERTLWKKGARGKWMPKILGNWSTTMTRPIAALNPISTGSEMKFATNPNRRKDAITRIPPTRSVSVAVAWRRDVASALGTASLS